MSVAGGVANACQICTRVAKKSTPRGHPWGVNLYLKGTFKVKEEELFGFVEKPLSRFSANL